MAALYAAGVRGSTLTAIAAWKEILLAVAPRARGPRRGPHAAAAVPSGARRLARARVRRGRASPTRSCRSRRSAAAPAHHAVGLAAKHDLVPVGAFFLGRSLRVGRDELRRLAWTLLGTAAFVAALGLVDVYAVSIGWWRTNGVVDYFHKQLGYDYHGTGEQPAVAGLPENFIYNTGVGAALPPQARLDVPQPARGRLPHGRRAVPRPVAPAQRAPSRRARVRRAALRTFSRSSLARARRRARRARARRAHVATPRARRGRRRRRRRLGARLPVDRADGELDEGGSRLPAGGGEGDDRARRAATRSPRTSRRSTSTGAR